MGRRWCPKVFYLRWKTKARVFWLWVIFSHFLSLTSSSAGEFWLGLEKIHSIAKDGGYILTIKLSDWGNDLASVRFPFQLGGEETKYSLKIHEADTFSTLESSLGIDATSGLPFSTRDQDNDQKNDTNCAKHLSGELEISITKKNPSISIDDVSSHD